MKIRTDYVTNSSSSSFIIAKHKDCTLGEVKEMLHQHEPVIKNLMSDLDYAPIQYNEVIEEIATDLLYDGWSNMTLGDWNVTSEYGSNDSDELLGCALYYLGQDMETEHLKVMRGG